MAREPGLFRIHGRRRDILAYLEPRRKAFPITCVLVTRRPLPRSRRILELQEIYSNQDTTSRVIAKLTRWKIYISVAKKKKYAGISEAGWKGISLPSVRDRTHPRQRQPLAFLPSSDNSYGLWTILTLDGHLVDSWGYVLEYPLTEIVYRRHQSEVNKFIRQVRALRASFVNGLRERVWNTAWKWKHSRVQWCLE